MPSRVFYESPLGPLLICGSAKCICCIQFVEDMGISDSPVPEIIIECMHQLHEYFHGERQEFDVLVDFGDATPFYREVWRLVRSIPHGHVRTYSDIANAIGRPHAMRAVGQANGHNPIPIIIPCHRVIGKDGQLTGYAYGLNKKEALLAMENPAHYHKQASLFHS